MKAGNLFDALRPDAAEEQFTTLLQEAGFVLERIVSTGQASPPGFWYDQERAEWVLLLRGAASPSISSPAEPRTLQLRPDRDRTTGFFIARLVRSS